MARNFYEVLGVPKDAPEKDIQKAYRDLARKYHPDLHPDDKDAAKKFSEVQEAFDTLNNKDKRKQYDQFGANYQQYQNAGAGAGFNPFGAGGNAGGFRGSFNGQDFDLNDILRGFAGGMGGGAGMGGASGGGFGGFNPFGGASAAGRRTRQQARPSKGADVQSELTIPFSLAVKGGDTAITLMTQEGQRRTLDVKVPAGISEGKKIRLRGQGAAAPMGGTPGDLLIIIHVEPHPYYSRQGDDLTLKLPITLNEAINGAKIDIPTPKGTVSMTIPAGTSSDKRLRMKGLGVAPVKGPVGDLYVEPRIILPKKITPEVRECAQKAESLYSGSIREGIRW